MSGSWPENSLLVSSQTGPVSSPFCGPQKMAGPGAGHSVVCLAAVGRAWGLKARPTGWALALGPDAAATEAASQTLPGYDGELAWSEKGCGPVPRVGIGASLLPWGWGPTVTPGRQRRRWGRSGRQRMPSAPAVPAEPVVGPVCVAGGRTARSPGPAGLSTRRVPLMSRHGGHSASISGCPGVRGVASKASPGPTGSV